MKPADLPAAIYKWGGPWPHEIAKTEMEYDADTGCVLLMWLPVPAAQAEYNKLIPGTDYKFVNELGEEISSEEGFALHAEAQKKRLAAERDAAYEEAWNLYPGLTP